MGKLFKAADKHLLLRKTEFPIRTDVTFFEVRKIFIIVFGTETLEAVG